VAGTNGEQKRCAGSLRAVQSAARS